jgi:hypothetical protein
MTQSRSKIAVTARALTALNDQMPPPVPDRFTDEVFQKTVARSMEIDRDSEITARILERADDDLLVTGEWDTMTKALHLTRFAAKPIARLCEVKLDFKKVNRVANTGPSPETVEVEAAVFSGFAHDVEHALLLLEATYRIAESEWTTFVASPAYKAMSRSAQVTRRNQHLRQAARDAGELFSRLSQEETLARLKDPDARECARIKRERIAL